MDSFTPKANTVYLLLGTNLGDRAANLAQAVALLEKRIGKVERRSGVYETEPWGVTNQPDYWNQVLQVSTPLEPAAVLEAMLGIERDMGRERHIRWEARLIDIDMLYFNDQVIETEHLQVPHPRMAQRRFVLEPLTELAPDFVHPVLGKKNRKLLEECADGAEVRGLPQPPPKEGAFGSDK
ncbi:MAG: 2-amino-4-hydroxy-6-hydroxymethyldihydropteridine diphosphokinase [Cytophagales bacterium]|jgi:2-amino-4-hydroxy-6-hydroxymethyldihydropteridine diphosphokinase|nr:2-amino-4-hydroxy-6-hydroxymethyldihydropteridine diphosphokinase [Cytophagales bacterium]